jgi:hypothetical protein
MNLFDSKRFLFVAKSIIILISVYLIYFWIGLFLYFEPDEISHSILYYSVALIVGLVPNLGIITALIPFFRKAKWVPIIFVTVSIVLYYGFFGGSFFYIGILGIITNILSLLFLFKYKLGGNKP